MNHLRFGRTRFRAKCGVFAACRRLVRPGLFTASAWLALTTVLVGCGHDAIAHAPNSPVAVRSESAVLTVWEVPATDNNIRVQARLVPLRHIARGSLEISAPGLTFSPVRFALRNLRRPIVGVRSHSHSHNPPALGKAYDYTFTAKTPNIGTYIVEVVLSVPGRKKASATVAVHVP